MRKLELNDGTQCVLFYAADGNDRFENPGKLTLQRGWYWQAGEGDPVGPFNTESEAARDAQGEVA